MKPCIVVVGYNRPDSLSSLLLSIERSSFIDNDITLIISLDKAENDHGVLSVAENFIWKHGNKIIRTFDKRQGLRNHIISCGDLSEKYGAVIILEDDLMVSPNFYSYVKKALDYYEDDENISGIALYSHEWNGYANTFFEPIKDRYDVFAGQFSITWGQAWTYKWWRKFKEWYLKNLETLPYLEQIPDDIRNWKEKSWGKYFIHYLVANDLFYIVPRVSLSTNCASVGEHARYHDNVHQVSLLADNDFSYNFAQFSLLTKYDCFFENIALRNIENVNDICVNLNNKKRKTSKRYLLTTKALPFKVLKSFGLDLRPIDYNVINNLNGNAIFLYDTAIKMKKPRSVRYQFFAYQIRGFKCYSLFIYSIKLFLIKLIYKIFK